MSKQYRPLILNGKGHSQCDCIGKLIIDTDINNKSNLIQVISSGNFKSFSKGYIGYMFEDTNLPAGIFNYLIQSNVPFLTDTKSIKTLVNNDIIEITPLKNIARVLFRADSGDNALVITNNCNCNCIMCPESFTIRQGPALALDKIINFVKLIDANTKFLCITGGEPTLLKEKLFTILDECRNRLPNTNFTFLTNARMLSYKDYAKEFNQHRPQHLLVGVALYGPDSEIHDFITNTAGSFVQTVKGIKNLLEVGIRTEIRIVISKLNYKAIFNLSNYIIKHFPDVLRVNIMALEMLGNAIINKGDVWVGYDEMSTAVSEASINLIKNGIHTYLYNFPLCFVNENLWSITIKSISDYKVRYYTECETCGVKEKCGGLFSSTINLKEIKVNPII